MKNLHPYLTRIILCLCLLLSVLLTACRNNVTDYSTDTAYQAVFSSDDGVREKELKNVLIEQIEAINRGDAESYYQLFDMEKEDYNFNVAQMKSILNISRITYTPEQIETAFLDDENAQARITMTCRADDCTTGETLYYYRTDITYTLVKNGSWKIIEQQNGSEYDLMDTLVSPEQTETAANAESETE